MLNTETSEPRRPSAGERMSDAPQRLRELSDVAKGRAVADGLAMAVGQAFAAEVESVRYGAFDRLREFRQPAELRVTSGQSRVRLRRRAGSPRVGSRALDRACR